MNSSRSQIIIKRPTHIKTHPRSRQADDVNELVNAPSAPNASLQASSSFRTLDYDGDNTDELSRIRVMLHPPPIPGVLDWGIPTASNAPYDPDIEASSFSTFLERHVDLTSILDETFRVSHAETGPSQSKALQ